MTKKLIKETGYLNDGEIHNFVRETMADFPVDGKKILFIIPDLTRSMPMPAMFRAIHEAVHGRAEKMDFLIALGTHPPLSDAAIEKLLGITTEERNTRFADIDIFNHEWKNPDALACIGEISAEEIAELSGGLLVQSAKVTINKRILDYDHLIVVGPVFPHEVVGFSGGNKYFYPGISGAEILNLFHWLGALITNYAINGTKDTAVRAVINRSASMIPVEKHCFCLTVVGKNTKALFFGTPEGAWSEAADLSKDTHIIYKEKPFKSILAMAPLMYDDLWVAGKCMYKLEPVVADGGELIIYGKHVRAVSVTHGELIARIGYHVRDYFVKQMDRFADIPGGILAHSTHVRGMGRFENGIEMPRVQVTLATSIPEAECRAINLGYRDPDSINPDDWRDQEDQGKLLVPDAGEILYRLRSEA
jgi:nickel-dependent lactate racemase